MFTGLVGAVGCVESMKKKGAGARLRLSAPKAFLDGESTGASIACAGACLTIAQMGEDWFEADVSPETLACTHLKDWRAGRAVNLEASLGAGEKIGGHFVFGHVDGVARITEVGAEGGYRRIEVAPPASLMPFLAPKGSVALDGVSLTINDAAEARFGALLIPHTLAQTTFNTLTPGAAVNIEADMLARYAARAAGALLAAQAGR